VQTLFNFKAETTTTYSYDTLDQLLGAVVTNSGGTPLTSEYEYDKAGNMLLNHTFSPSTTYTNEHMKYNEANEICAIATTAPSECASPSEPGIAGQPTYDKDGNMTSDGLLGGANKFAYTARDQLSSITPHGESAKQVVSHGTGQADLAALGSEEVITNVLGVGVTGSGESAKYYTRADEGGLLARRTAKGKPSETEYFTLDPFGSVALLTNSSGSQTAPATGNYQYDPYGSPIGAAPATFAYESGQTLPGGLVHYGARYYDPGLGSRTQQDPAGAEDGYGFVSGDPINEADPSGLLSVHYAEVLTCKALAAGNHHDPGNVYYFDRKAYAYCQWVFRNYLKQAANAVKVTGGLHFNLTLNGVACTGIGAGVAVATSGGGLLVELLSGSAGDVVCQGVL
jgi:RHS repeat-associated protein